MVENTLTGDERYDPRHPPGSYQLATLALGGIPMNFDKLRVELAKRTLEEMVELCLSLGMSPGEVHLHVTDAIYSECKKIGIYPSEWDTKKAAYIGKTKGEIVDVEIVVDCIRETCHLARVEIEEHKKTKLELLRLRVRDGYYKVVDGYRMYKKDR
jgi:hypothetical protein